MMVGRYAGVEVDKLPNSYLRWIITQNFPKSILEAAQKKLKESDYNDLYLNVSRHAIDMYSKRFLYKWLDNGKTMEDSDGLATFITKAAQEAWDKGTDVSKHRHQDDGIVKEWAGIKWIFGVNPNYPDYRDVITVMDSTNE
ncbi:MAG: hypothetical protein UW07_C0019G0002 [Candidatus Nomurabacteria bacterium GW2011_GWF2_43_8]|uniref:Uncharacterized protein n=3 Tax=Parcubacteria group TaxID=1794811 RepID=A0A0G1FPE9_9BACT|nr:MAG: hypothetical protein UW02_C0002G0022 [Candidatus Nomurabacteria bacterium GW2011_GWB1_43_7]KKT23923.1 MAG: hypothetical protein UW07_C0019G0002 [Candidatus Nomurabacteria bacterium GW2011_GWF2_43_8]KKU05038.1 MAG: hypothetical protein UX06_C0004G0006 [Candidatus Giovannonibacteria bacterium GW2011_GWA2_45_21]